MSSSDLASESLKNLRAKCEEHESNLFAIDSALESDPNSEELLKLKKDLEEVISFFRDLINQKVSDSEHVDENESVNYSIDELTGETGGGVGEIRSEMTDENGSSTTTTSSFGLIGRTCLLSSTLKFGRIIGVGKIDHKSELPLTIKVKWFNLDEDDQIEEEIPAHSVRLLTPIPIESVHIGMNAQALYSGDGQWYRCIVCGIIDNGKKYEISYPDYDDYTEIIPADRLRPPDINITKSNNATNNSNSNKDKKVKEVITPAGYVIPMNLIVKPGDTEAQRAGKRRRLTKLKKDQKNSAAEEEARLRQLSWQSHARKTSTKTTARLQTALLRAKEGRIRRISRDHDD